LLCATIIALANLLFAGSDLDLHPLHLLALGTHSCFSTFRALPCISQLALGAVQTALQLSTILLFLELCLIQLSFELLNLPR